MKSKNTDRNFFYIFRNLRAKHRLSLKDQHTDTEVWYMYISPLKALASFLALVLVLFIIILTTVAYTPILDMIPGYPGNRSRELLMSNIMRLDSMEREINNLQVYSDNVALILDGKTPVMRTVAHGADTTGSSKTELVQTSYEDSLLRQQIEGGGIYRLNESGVTNKKGRTDIELMPPVKGVVASRFNPKQEKFGIEIATAANQKVVAVEEGTVIFAMWSPDDGYVVQIQHSGNLISIYKHSTQAVKSIGARVKAGEVVGYTGDGVSGDAGKGMFEFELWHNGTPVDPEGYIVF